MNVLPPVTAPPPQARNGGAGGSAAHLANQFLRAGIWILLAVFFFYVVRNLAAAALSYWFAAELGAAANWNPLLVNAGAAVLFPLFYSLAWRVFQAGEDGRAAEALAGLLVAALAVFSYLETRESNFVNGRPARFYAQTPDGIYYANQGGRDPKYGLTLREVTPEAAAMLHLIESRRFYRAEPAESFWFHPNTGDPLLWCARNEHGQLEFYSRPGRHPLSGALLVPVTLAVRQEWLAASRPGAAELQPTGAVSPEEVDRKPSPLSPTLVQHQPNRH